MKLKRRSQEKKAKTSIRSCHLLVGAGAAVTLHFGGSYPLKLKRLSNELETETKASIHRVSLSGIELSINLKVKSKHPTKCVFLVIY
jgi:hypothetical protein